MKNEFKNQYLDFGCPAAAYADAGEYSDQHSLEPEAASPDQQAEIQM